MAGIITIRLGAPAVIRVVRATPIPNHRWDGVVTALPALGVALLALRYGLPVWGWLP